MEKTTRKNIKSSYKNIIAVNYEKLNYLLSDRVADYYTEGIYGWNTNVYQIDNDTAITMGYRPFGNFHPKNEILKKYNFKAKEILSKPAKTQDDLNTRTKKLEKLISEFVNNVVKGE